jgi:hypothetical protein
MLIAVYLPTNLLPFEKRATREKALPQICGPVNSTDAPRHGTERSEVAKVIQSAAFKRPAEPANDNHLHPQSACGSFASLHHGGRTEVAEKLSAQRMTSVE